MNGLGQVLTALESLEITMGTDAVYVVGSNVEYAIHQEFGTSEMSAQPYLRPAVRETQRNIGKLARQASTGDELIKLVALDIEKRAKQKAPVDTGNLRNSIRAEKQN